MTDQNPLTPQRVAEPLPEWLAEIEAYNWANSVQLARLLELAKAQRAALLLANKYLPREPEIVDAYFRARRLWEGR